MIETVWQSKHAQSYTEDGVMYQVRVFFDGQHPQTEWAIAGSFYFESEAIRHAEALEFATWEGKHVVATKVNKVTPL